jgi:predicted O-methyltransferase YrrM
VFVHIDPTIASVIDELEELRKSRDDHFQVPRIEGRLLFQFALASGAKSIVEVGTSYGFSGLFWAAALKQTGGRLQTIDMSQKKYDSSRQTFARAAVASLVTNHLGNALEVLPTIAGPIDIAFLDADKPALRQYFDIVWPKIRPGGSVLTDNALTHKTELAEFISYVRGRPDTVSSEIPVGNGLEWTVKV